MILVSAMTATGASAAGLPGNTQQHRPVLTHDLTVLVNYARTGDSLTISGTKFPPEQHISLFLLFNNRRMVHLRGWKADRNGNITVTVKIATYPLGTEFRVLARAHGGMRVMSNLIIIGETR
jgi:hypothetical protein